MKLSRKALLALICIIILFPLFFILRTVPMTKIWNSYSVLYVAKQLDESTVLDILEQNGVPNVISLSRQKTPFVSQVTPIESRGSAAYLNSRLSYFFDSSHDFELYYIPEGNESHTEKAVKQIVKQYKVTAGLDGRQRFPVLVPIVTLIVYAVLVAFAKAHLVVALPGLFCVLLSFSQPFYPVASANCLFLLALFFAQRVWKRKNALLVLRKNLYVILLLATSCAVCFLCSWRALILMLCVLVSGTASLVLLSLAEEYIDSKKAFTYTKIFPANQIALVYAKNANVFFYIAIPLALLTLMFLLSARFSSGTSTKVSIPSPVHSGGTFPVLEDYEEWVWKQESFPYRSLNHSEENEDEKTVTLTRYVSGSEGIITTTETLMKFDDDYIKKVDEGIDRLPYPAIEKLMKRQGRNVNVAYSEHGGIKQQRDSISLVLMLVSLVLPLLLSSYYYVFGRGRYENRK